MRVILVFVLYMLGLGNLESSVKINEIIIELKFSRRVFLFCYLEGKEDLRYLEFYFCFLYYFSFEVCIV